MNGKQCAIQWVKEANKKERFNTERIHLRDGTKRTAQVAICERNRNNFPIQNFSAKVFCANLACEKTKVFIVRFKFYVSIQRSYTYSHFTLKLIEYAKHTHIHTKDDNYLVLTEFLLQLFSLSPSPCVCPMRFILFQLNREKKGLNKEKTLHFV